MADTPDDQMLVTLTRGQLKALVFEAASEAVRLHGSSAITPWTDVAAVAKHFDVSGQTIKNWIARGAPARKVGSTYRIKLVDFEAWVNTHSAHAAAS